MHRSNQFIFPVYIVIVILFFLPTTSRGVDVNLKIGVVLPLTGSLAPYSEEILQGMETALHIVKKNDPNLYRRISIIKRDDRGVGSHAKKLAKDLIHNKKVHIIYGSLTGAISANLALIAHEYKRPLVSPITTSPLISKASPFVFTTSINDYNQGVILAKYTRKNLYKSKAAILFRNDNDYTTSIAKSFRTTFLGLGGRITDYIPYKDESTDFASKIKLIAKNKPDIIMVPGFHDEATKILEEAKKEGIRVPFIGSDSWEAPEIYSSTRVKLFKKNYFFKHFSEQDPHPTASQFVKTYTKLHRKKPSSLAAMGYDGLMVIISAFKKADSNLPTPLIRTISQSTDTKGLNGIISFDSNRNAIKPGAIIVITETGPRFMTRLSPR